MKNPTDSFTSYSFHRPVTAHFRPFDDFCCIDIGDTNGIHDITILLGHRNGHDLLFLYQLREAVEKAFQFHLEQPNE